MEGFATGLFYMTNEFRIYGFDPELTPLLAYAQSLQNNNTLQTLGFARNGLDEDSCAAILQNIYHNPVLKCVDLNGNPVGSSTFNENYIKPYFSSRKDLNIIYD